MLRRNCLGIRYRYFGISVFRRGVQWKTVKEKGKGGGGEASEFPKIELRFPSPHKITALGNRN